MLLSDIVQPGSNVARSVNIERDLGNEATLKQYIMTDKGADIISRFISALAGEKISAWSLTGPYGMGKSAFVNFLLSLCGPDNQATKVAAAILKKRSPGLYKKFVNLTKQQKQQGFLRIAATASFEPINRTLARALRQAVKHVYCSPKQRKELSHLESDIRIFIDQDCTDTTMLLRLIRRAGRLHGAPLVIVLDEFGKNLEFMAQHAGDGDLYILQLLAESNGIFIWVCLHQAFEEHASSLTNKQVQEWGKIQGRFEDISFIEPRRQMVQFIGSTLFTRNGNFYYEKRGLSPEGTEAKSQLFGELLKSWTNFFFDQLTSLELPDKEIIDKDSIAACYPLHPLVVYTLPDLCCRFAQNDRTLFSFLCGGDSYALPNFIKITQIDVDKGELTSFRPAALYDYFLAVTNTLSMNRPESKRWFEVNSIIEETSHFPRKEREVLKVVALLNLLAQPAGLRASRDIVVFACSCPGEEECLSRDDTLSILEKLSQKGLLIYRQYADEYRLWEGTDIDFDEALEAYRTKLTGIALNEMLTQTAPLMPVVAARHSYETGSVRHFERRWISLAGLQENIQCESPDADGLLLQCFGEVESPEIVPAKTDDGRPILVAYAPSEKQIQQAIIEAASINIMIAESSELARDSVARKEARYRAQIATKKLTKLIDQEYSPGSNSLLWFIQGRPVEISSHRVLSRQISTVCDVVYSDCPTVRNELINRNNLSSATARARREVIDAMILGAEEQMLGLSGTGPEVAIYRTMLLSGGVHKQIGGSWGFLPPTEGSTYFPAWNALDKLIEKAEESELSVSSMVRELQQAPVGMKYGPVPIFLCLYLLVEADELALYREGRFLPALTCDEMELMVKRPELFTVKRFASTGIRGEIFQVYRELLNTSPAAGQKIRNADMVSVVGPLVQFANTLSDYVKQTKTISKHAQAARRVLLAAKDPITLLFSDLPEALGCGAFSDSKEIDPEQVGKFQQVLRDALIELSKADQILQQNIADNILQAFNWQEDVSLLQKELQSRAIPLRTRCADKQLKPFLTALCKLSTSNDEWLVSVGTIINQRPVDSWRDNDLQIFTAKVHDFSRRFSALEAVVTAELSLPVSQDGRDVRFVAIMDGSGAMPGKVVTVNKETESSMRKIMNELEGTYDTEELEALMVLLGEQLLASKEKGLND